MTVGLRSIAVSLPERSIAVDELPEVTRLGDVEAQTFRGLGIDTVGHDPSRSAADLAADAARATLTGADMSADRVDALLLVQPRVPDFFMASEATRVQAAIGAHKAMTFTAADLGCVSISAALITGRALLAEGSNNNVLIVHGSKPPTPRRYRHPVTINGEGGVALLMTPGGDPSLIDIGLETDGRYWDLFRVRYADIPRSQWFEECTSPQDYSFKLAVESRNRFAALNEGLLTRNQLAPTDVQHFVMQNLSLGAFRFYEEFFDITFATACKENLQRHGHLGSMDIVFNLKTGIDSGEFSPGDLVLVMNNSPVAAWSSMLVRV